MKPLLLVFLEHSAKMRTTIVDILELEGYRVIHADDTVKAIAMIEDHQPNLLICDLASFEKSIGAVLDTAQRGHRIPVMILTDLCLTVSFTGWIDRYLPIPFDAVDLLTAIDEIFESRDGTGGTTNSSE